MGVGEPGIWKPSEVIWKPMATPAGTDPPETFPLIVHCRTEEERDQIFTELTKHGIKCSKRRADDVED